MPELSGSATHRNLLAAFRRESQAAHRYLWFAQQAHIDGRPEVADLFRSLADAETGHIHGLLEFLAEVGDPLTGGPIGETDDNVRAALAAETDDAAETFPAFAATARAEGLDAVADWFDALAAAECDQARRLRSAGGDTG